MKHTRQQRISIIWVLALVMLTVIAASAGAAGAEEQYTENEWNFIDRSMDVTQGIPEDAEGVLASIRESRTLRVATDPYFAPQEFIDPTKVGQKRFAGADMELARLIADRMGVTLEIIPMDFSEVLLSLNDNVCDLAISALSYVPARAASYTLSKGYYFSDDNSGSGILIRSEDQDSLHVPDDFAGKVIAAESSSLQESLMAENFPRYKEFIRYTSLDDACKALSDGAIDGLMLNTETALAYIERNPESSFMLIPDLTFTLEEPYQGDRIAAKKGQTQLIAFVNGVIDEVVADGQYMEWYREADEYAKSIGL